VLSAVSDQSTDNLTNSELRARVTADTVRLICLRQESLLSRGISRHSFSSLSLFIVGDLIFIANLDDVIVSCRSALGGRPCGRRS
jgi:hypothetical protein